MRPSLFTLALAGLASAAAAQTPAPAPTPVLTVEEAVRLARRNNPAHLQTLNNRNVAGAQLRSAYGAFLPSADASFGTQFREGRPQFFGGQQFGSTADVIASSYDLTVSARYNAATLIGPKLQRANVRAADAEAAGSDQQVRATVTQQYLTVLQSQARAALQDTLVVAAQTQLELARAREAVGSATLLDVRRAEVALGQQQVAALNARNTVEVEKVRLFQQMGVPQPADVQLTSTFQVSEFTTPLEELLATARRANPTLQAARSRENVAGLSFRSAQGQYTPTLQLQTFWGGYTNQYTDDNFIVEQQRGNLVNQCEFEANIRSIAGQPSDPAACQSITLTPQQIREARASNEAFPFDFERNPWEVRASVSIPIFNGFTREQQLQEAAAGRADARYNVRAQELATVANVTGAYLNLQTARRTVALQEQNSQTARDALTLAEERFRVGANTFLDVTQARSEYERAETERINAVYDFQRNFAALENAVGRSLR